MRGTPASQAGCACGRRGTATRRERRPRLLREALMERIVDEGAWDVPKLRAGGPAARR